MYLRCILKYAANSATLHWQIQALVYFVYFDYVEFMFKLFPGSICYSNSVRMLYAHEMVLKFRYTWMPFCEKVYKCEVVRGYAPRLFNVPNMPGYISEDFQVRCGNLAYGVPASRKTNDSKYQIRCVDCQDSMKLMCEGYHMTQEKYSNTPVLILCLIEGFNREVYQKKYDLPMDLGHEHRMNLMKAYALREYQVVYVRWGAMVDHRFVHFARREVLALDEIEPAVDEFPEPIEEKFDFPAEEEEEEEEGPEEIDNEFEEVNLINLDIGVAQVLANGVNWDEIENWDV